MPQPVYMLLAALLVFSLVAFSPFANAARNSARTLYDVLGVNRQAGKDEIKKHYRELAKKYHPDKTTDAADQDKFIELTSAYEVLTDDDKRKEYERSLRSGFGRRDDKFARFKRGGGDGTQGKDPWTVLRSKNGKIIFTTSSGFRHEFSGGGSGSGSFFHEEPASIFAVTGALWPLIKILFFFGLFCILSMTCCCLCLRRTFFPNAGRKNVDRSVVEEKARERNGTSSSGSKATSRPSSSSSSSSSSTKDSLPKATENKLALIRRGVLVVISMKKDITKKLLSLKEKFANDSVTFYEHIAPHAKSSTGDDFELLILSKGGQRWCIFSHDVHGYGMSDVEAFLVKLLGGQVAWTLSDEHPVPVPELL